MINNDGKTGSGAQDLDTNERERAAAEAQVRAVLRVLSDSPDADIASPGFERAVEAARAVLREYEASLETFRQERMDAEERDPDGLHAHFVKMPAMEMEVAHDQTDAILSAFDHDAKTSGIRGTMEYAEAVWKVKEILHEHEREFDRLEKLEKAPEAPVFQRSYDYSCDSSYDY